MKTAICTGATGQTGSYLCEILLDKGYKVVGTRRRTTTPNNENVEKCLKNENFILEIADITDYPCVSGLVDKYNPDEIYNLAAQSFVKVSFDQPIHTFDVDTYGVLNFLEVIKNKNKSIKFYQASTSELFGKSYSCMYTPFMSDDLVRYDNPDGNRNTHEYIHKIDKAFQDELTPFSPQSPYGIAKLAAHHLCRLYKQSYDMFCVCGILFNHESPRRGKEFLTRKVTDYVGKLYVNSLFSDNRLNNYPKLRLGNLDAYRDWGFAGDYAYAQYLMMQNEKPEDFVICTEESHTVREFCDIAFSYIGMDYKDWVVVDPQFYRPSEVDYLCGKSTKAKEKLKWKPTVSFKDLVENMVNADLTRYA